MAGKRQRAWTRGLIGAWAMAALGLSAGCAHGQHPPPLADEGSGLTDGGLPAGHMIFGPGDDRPPRPSGLGGYLAARHAEARGDTAAAALFYRRALQDDPDNVRLLRRAYFFTTVEGDVPRAALLAERLLTQDPGASIAPLIIAVDRIAQNDWATAEALIAPLSRQGLNGFLVPVMLAWIHTGQGGPQARSAALAALDELEDNPGYQALGRLHGALILDLMGDGAAAVDRLNAYLDASDQPSLRGIQLAGGILLRRAAVTDAQTPDTTAAAGSTGSAPAVPTPRAPRIAPQDAGESPTDRVQEPALSADGLAPMPAPDTNDPAARARALVTTYTARFPDSLLLDNAIQDFDRPGGPAPEITSARQGLADLFHGTASLLADNDTQTAAMFVRLALHLNPDFPLARLLLGQLLANQDRHDEALQAFQSIADTPGLGLVAGLSQADSLLAADRGDEAITTLRKVAQTWPDRATPLIDLGDVLRRKERFREAAEAYTEALDRLGPPRPRHWPVLFGRGVAYERLKEWPKAEADFQTALVLSPDQPFVLNYLGYSWVDQGINIEAAKQMIETAVAQRPKDGYIIDSLGWAHFRLGEFEKAVDVLEGAVRESPDDATINDHLGDAYWRVGRRLEARYQWRRALGLSEDPDLSQAIKTKLADGLPPLASAARDANTPHSD